MKKIYFTFALVLLTCTFSQASELILRINRNGQFIVSASNQTQTNNTNTYQFYNLYGGTTQVKVSDKLTGQVIFKNNLNIPEGHQLVADLDHFGTMTILASIPLASSNGGWSNTVGTINYGNNGNWNNGAYPNNHCGSYPNNPGDGYYNQGQSINNTFNQFVTSLRTESFDSNRLQNAKVYASKTNLSANQIKEIAATFTFDSNRLDWAKTAYSSCYDKGNYFLLRETFTFSSSYSELQNHISTQ